MVTRRAGLWYAGGRMNQSPTSHLTFDSVASYRIQVRGRIAPNRADWFQGMSVRPLATLGDEPESTQLEGELHDQAALAGVLNTLYDLHLPVLSVECLRARPAEES